MKGRSTPNRSAYRDVLQSDEEFFLENPHITERRRAVVPGETTPDGAPLPPGTTVIVKRIGAYRVRLFAWPDPAAN